LRAWNATKRFVTSICTALRWSQSLTVLLAALCVVLLTPAARAADERIPFPPELQRDVNFWIRVYSEISTSEGFLHDDRDLSLVYRTLRFERGVTPRQRRDSVDAEREKLETMLKRLAAGAVDLTQEEQHLATLFGAEANSLNFAEAAKRVRFQLGQSDRFREGVERSGAWEGHIAQTFANLGLPSELAILPHVESSFDPTAYSKVGAAGLWQFMSGTARRYVRVDDAVDERLDPFRATEAAAQLLDFNYRFLGSWPLALTAYNHGAAGMRRARDAMGTTDIATIVRKHQSPSFGFASRNFYVSFLAALTIDRNPEKYFGNISRHPEVEFAEVEMPAFVPLAAVQRAVKVDKSRLVSLNPALRPTVWDGRRFVPKGYRLRLPMDSKAWTPELLAQQIAANDQYINQPRSRSYRVRTGDTLAKVARQHGTSASVLTRINNLPSSVQLRRRMVLRLPETPATRVSGAQAGVAASDAGATEVLVATAAPVEIPPELRPEPAVVKHARVAQPVVKEPVTAAEARDAGPSLAPGGAVAQTSESIDYDIEEASTIRVEIEESLGHYAQWLKLPTQRLRQLNRLGSNAQVVLGAKVKLDFSKVSQEQFTVQRRAFHESLQTRFFSVHRIIGTKVYVTRRGDSLWNVAQRNGGLPAWLLLHYNPDIDFNSLRAGLEIVIPKVEAAPA
jgi:membrane-bound lytic murein transglycosylase D